MKTDPFFWAPTDNDYNSIVIPTKTRNNVDETTLKVLLLWNATVCRVLKVKLKINSCKPSIKSQILIIRSHYMLYLTFMN